MQGGIILDIPPNLPNVLPVDQPIVILPIVPELGEPFSLFDLQSVHLCIIFRCLHYREHRKLNALSYETQLIAEGVSNFLALRRAAGLDSYTEPDVDSDNYQTLVE